MSHKRAACGGPGSRGGGGTRTASARPVVRIDAAQQSGRGRVDVIAGVLAVIDDHAIRREARTGSWSV